MSQTSASAMCISSSILEAEMSETPSPTELLWYVAHTRPRCEKKLATYCEQEGFEVTLPLINSVRKYQRKTVVFEKPLFPNYVFMRLNKEQRRTIYQSKFVANLLDVPDQQQFSEQLEDILAALETEEEIYLAPQIKNGSLVKIKAGPLRGSEGWVEKRSGMVEVQLRLDFIGQAAAIMIPASDLELA